MVSNSADMPNLAASGCRSWVRTIFAARSTAPPDTQVWRPRAAGPAAAGRCRRRHEVLVDAQHLLDDLPGQRGEALPGLDGRADHGGQAVVDLHGRGGDLVCPRRPACAPCPARSRPRGAPRRVRPRPPAAGQQPLGLVVGGRQRRQVASRTAFSSSPTGAGQVTVWPVGSRSPVASTLRMRNSAGSRPSGGELVHLALVGAQTCIAPSPRTWPAGGCWCAPPSPRRRRAGTT